VLTSFSLQVEVKIQMSPQAGQVKLQVVQLNLWLAELKLRVQAPVQVEVQMQVRGQPVAAG
jgi:hypothetical protein